MTKFDREYVGANVWVRRSRMGMSQAELAKRLDVSVGWVSRLETGDTFASIQRVIELAELFECTPNDLLSGAPPEPKKKTEPTDYTPLTHKAIR